MISIQPEKKYPISLRGFCKEESQSIDSCFLDVKEPGNITLSDKHATAYVYLGDKNKVDFDLVYNHLKNFLAKISYDLDIDIDSFNPLANDKVVQGVIQACLYGHHNFYTLKAKKPREVNFNLITKNNQLENILKKNRSLMESLNACRDWCDLPPNICTPKGFVELASKFLRPSTNLKISTLNRHECEQLGMGLFLSVAQGGINEPQFMIVEYEGNPASNDKTAFIGKGITFDSGGYALKPLIGQRNERYDMCGAAAVIAAMHGIAKEAPKTNIVAIAPLAENRIGGGTTLNSSIVTSMSGRTVEVVSTDAEGRMVMADAITYAIKHLKATKIVTVATLTGAMIMGLGKYTTGAMSRDDNFFQEFWQAAQTANERFWRMPLEPESFKAMTESKYADLNNHVWIKYNPPGNAAAFLDIFSEDKPFIHIDIAGSAYIDDRSKGTMVKSIIEYACQTGQ
ncbi:leucyl aminopeptidase [Entomoplasma freundtii]|uniref:Probable cytosol aminopeptidase n=1 Tax=Entomoplasma freundtii TaxID=74700 RepID=A0A2K8NU99_9MOLU|nr:M17 family metallopeptidase [Entomoplasma freundtii]ATZ16341.1 leucyl aminopeptidase [Entomoplasma freundtii]TDY56620.1 leucyl aminopeptidase [Entomoplasma freundtii]